MRTREHILDVAERLFAEHGIDGPSLNEINTQAGQRNKTSLQYHFGGRGGLVEAILARHREWFRTRGETLAADLVQTGRLDDVRSLVELQIRPLAEYVALGRSQRYYVRIWAEVLASPDTRLEEIKDRIDQPVQTDTARRLIAIMARAMPRELAVERLTGMLQSAVHAFADRAVLEDAVNPRRTLVPLPIVTANLVDMISAALTAPVSPETLRAINVTPDTQTCRG